MALADANELGRRSTHPFAPVTGTPLRNGYRPRITVVMEEVLLEFLKSPTSEIYGWDICLQTGYPTGTIYPLLVRMEQAGWLRSRWEECDPSTAGRPRRRYYQLTEKGLEVGRPLSSAVGPVTTAVSSRTTNLHLHSPEACED
jgi:PadR family transcriptional regulator PadR